MINVTSCLHDFRKGPGVAWVACGVQYLKTVVQTFMIGEGEGCNVNLGGPGLGYSVLRSKVLISDGEIAFVGCERVSREILSCQELSCCDRQVADNVLLVMITRTRIELENSLLELLVQIVDELTGRACLLA